MFDMKRQKMNAREWFVVALYGIYLVRTIGAWSMLPRQIDTVVFSLLGVIGALFLAFDFFQILTRKQPFTWDVLLTVFVVSLVIGSLINYHYSPIGNLKVAAWQGIILLVIYQLAKDSRTSNQFFIAFKQVVTGFGFIMSTISVGMFITLFQYVHVLSFKQNPLRIGFVQNRLFGAYDDPNYAAVAAVVVIIFSIDLMLHFAKSAVTKFYYGFNVFIQLSYIGLSGSRNGQVVLFAVTAAGIFFASYYWKKMVDRGLLTRVFASILIAVICGALSFGAVTGLKKAYSFVPTIIGTATPQDHSEETRDGGDVSIDLTRQDVADSGDVSNLRFTLWKSGLEIWKHNVLFGMPPKAVHAYAQDKLPNTYLAKTKLAVHSAYIYLLSSSGIVGTVIMLLFIVATLVQAMVFAFTNPSMTKEYVYYLLAALAFAVSGLFHNELFLMSAGSSMAFWISIGRVNGMEGLHKGVLFWKH